MSRWLYFGIVLAIVGFVAFVLHQAITDPVSFAANREAYIRWALVVAIVTFLVACLSTGRWMVFGLACLALGAWYAFRVEGGAMFSVPR